MIISYATRPSHSPRRHPAWWLLMGPGTGAVVGIIQAVTMTLMVAITDAWPMYGGMFLLLALAGSAMCGAAVGMAYGLILLVFECMTDRRAQAVKNLQRAICCMGALTVIFGFIVGALGRFGEHEVSTLLAVLLPATATLLLALCDGIAEAARPDAVVEAMPAAQAASPSSVAHEEKVP